MESLLHRRVVWVGGKGGVGKTTIAAGLAMLAASRGKRCLVVSTDPAHSLGDAFGHELDDAPRRILPNLDAMEIDPDIEVEAHLSRVTEQMRRFAAPEMMRELERQMQLSRQSPGTQEAALLERIARLITDTESAYDLIVFDTAPTGHTLRLLILPEAMAAWTDGLLNHNRKSRHLSSVLKHLTPGAGKDLDSPFADPAEGPDAELDDRTQDIARTLLSRKRLFMQARRLIADPAYSGFLFVLTPERLPLVETVRAVATLEDAKVPVVAALINRVIPAEAEGEFARRRREQEQKWLHAINEQLRHLPRPQIPWLEGDIEGISGLKALVPFLRAAGF